MSIRIRRLILAFGDVALCYAALYAALGLRSMGPVETWEYILHCVSFTPVFFVWTLVLFGLGLYEFRGMRSLFSLIRNSSWALLINLLIGASLFYTLSPYHGLTPKTRLALAALIAHASFFLWRHVWVRIAAGNLLHRRVAFLGSNPILKVIVADLAHHPQYGYQKTVHPRLAEFPTSNETEHWLPTSTDSGSLKHHSDLVVVDEEWTHSNPGRFKALFKAAVAADVPVISHLAFYEMLYGKVPPSSAARPEWLMSHVLSEDRRVYSILKRSIDLAASGAALACLSPLLVTIAAISSLCGHRPFFRQVRVGFKGREFRILKFRTMIENSESHGPLKRVGRGDLRVTRWGAFLRRFRLDELPQLWNVLEGDMSLVGPRPEWSKEVRLLERAVPHYHLRHLAKPGITGWAQINFRATSNAEDSLEKLQYDLYYIKHMSPALDMGILLKTIKRVLMREQVFGRIVSGESRLIPESEPV